MIDIDWPHTFAIAAINAVALFVSIWVVGIVTKPITDYFHAQLRRQHGEDYKPAERINWIGSLIGYLERGLLTILVIWLPGAVGPTLAAIIAVKAASGWGSMGQDKPAGRARYFVIFMGTMVSCTLAVVCGLVTASLIGRLL